MDHANVNKYDGGLLEEYFAGVVCRSSEYLVIQGKTAYRCQTIRKNTAETAYDQECLEHMVADLQTYLINDAVASRQHKYTGHGEANVLKNNAEVRA